MATCPRLTPIRVRTFPHRDHGLGQQLDRDQKGFPRDSLRALETRCSRPTSSRAVQLGESRTTTPDPRQLVPGRCTIRGAIPTWWTIAVRSRRDGRASARGMELAPSPIPLRASPAVGECPPREIRATEMNQAVLGVAAGGRAPYPHAARTLRESLHPVPRNHLGHGGHAKRSPGRARTRVRRTRRAVVAAATQHPSTKMCPLAYWRRMPASVMTGPVQESLQRQRMCRPQRFQKTHPSTQGQRRHSHSPRMIPARDCHIQMMLDPTGPQHTTDNNRRRLPCRTSPMGFPQIPASP